jgi:hypothetical protein
MPSTGGPVNPLFDFGYRIVAIGFCIYCGCTVWYGLIERKITFFNTDLLDWWTPNQIFQRDIMPVRYWMQIGLQAISSVFCFVAGIIGWQPTT